MSLLMQALRKAERARQEDASGEELAEPVLGMEVPLSLAPIDDGAPAPPIEAELPRRDRSLPPPPVERPRRQAPSMPMPEPRTIRILVLGAIALLIAAVFGYMYWRAMYGPGSSKNLPMVPMPGQDAGIPGVPSIPAPSAAPSADGLPAPSAPPPSHIQALGPEDYVRMDMAQGGGVQGSPPPAPVAVSAPAPLPVAPPPVAQAPAANNTPTPAPRRARPARTESAAADPIRVARASTPAQVPLAVQNAYAAFQAGDLASARRHYQAMLLVDPNNRDALLGSAAIYLRQGDPRQAGMLYARLLEADPNDTDALAALSGLRQADPGQSETRLRRALERDPESGAALFALGNLHAREGRWAEAQQHYFRAFSADPGNADYAFNLAVGLDRLNQSKLALEYYQRAIALAGAGAVSFDRNAAATRARELGGP
jgi:Tfp pilus assembly protein PilF